MTENEKYIQHGYISNNQTPNIILMQKARASLKNYWGLAIGSVLIFFIILLGSQSLPFAGFMISYFISGAMTVGICTFALALSRNANPEVSLVFNGFKKYWVTLGAFVLFNVFIFLWSLIGIIPLILAAIAYTKLYMDLALVLYSLALLGFIPCFIAMFSYSMCYFIIADDYQIGSLQAISKSKRIMKGNKWKLFCLGWRFFWWGLLSIITLGIGFIWLAPYVLISKTKFYDDILPTDNIVVH